MANLAGRALGVPSPVLSNGFSDLKSLLVIITNLDHSKYSTVTGPLYHSQELLRLVHKFFAYKVESMLQYFETQDMAKMKAFLQTQGRSC